MSVSWSTCHREQSCEVSCTGWGHIYVGYTIYCNFKPLACILPAQGDVSCESLAFRCQVFCTNGNFARWYCNICEGLCLLSTFHTWCPEMNCSEVPSSGIVLDEYVAIGDAYFATIGIKISYICCCWYTSQPSAVQTHGASNYCDSSSHRHSHYL